MCVGTIQMAALRCTNPMATFDGIGRGRTQWVWATRLQAQVLDIVWAQQQVVVADVEVRNIARITGKLIIFEGQGKSS
jgi:hypothetical protein